MSNESVKHRIFAGASAAGINTNVLTPTQGATPTADPFTADRTTIHASSTTRFASENFLITT